jgi:16S rRNA (uracil1498-N3)-methyltransferase
MLPRFFAPSFDAGDETAQLPRDEAEHLTRVLRLGAGDTISVFDGRGSEFLARVVAAERRTVRVQILSRIEAAAEPAVPITLAQAVLKADKMDDVVRDAVMMGAAAVQPLVTRRAETTVAALVRGTRLDRWRRIALASVKQSRRAVLPEIRVPLTLDDYVNEPLPELTAMLVEPASEPEATDGAAEPRALPISAVARLPVPHDAALLVGPEGGWDRRERAAAAGRGIKLFSLGARTLRADAVPVAAISICQFVWGDL